MTDSELNYKIAKETKTGFTMTDDKQARGKGAMTPEELAQFDQEAYDYRKRMEQTAAHAVPTHEEVEIAIFGSREKALDFYRRYRPSD